MSHRPTSARRRSFALARCLAGVLAVGCARRVRGDDPRLRYEGRVAYERDGAVRLAWPHSAVHLRFRGTRATLRVEEVMFPREAPEPDAVGISVDGGPLRRVTLRPGVQALELAEGLPTGAHTARVVKLTEAEIGAVRVLALGLADGAVLLDPPPAPPRRLMAIGDSIAVGYGVDGPDGSCVAVGATRNAAHAWPALAASALGAELHLLAWSGRGLTRNYDPSQPETLPTLLQRTIPTDPTNPWDEGRWIPTDVAVNVGTNDVAHAPLDDAAYASALRAMLRRVLARAPAARVRVLVGPMIYDDGPTPGANSLQRVRAATDAVSAGLREEGYDVARAEVYGATPDEGYGCEAHPSRATQRRIAETVVGALNEGIRR
ncbi:MAG: GDSL-type esterase/lipase family protein [Polyangiales bacterium]